MRRRRDPVRRFFWIAIASALPVIACNALLGIGEYEEVSNDDGDGTTGTGGNGMNTGGLAGSSGTGAGGGSGAVGGTGSSGGTEISGGTAGSGAGAGGAAGTSGASGVPCESEFEPGDYTFETSSTEGFELGYTDPGSLADSSSLEGVGGALRMTIAFDGSQQELYAAATLDPPVDLAGKTVTACVRLVDNVDEAPQLPEIELFAESGPSQDQGFSNKRRFENTNWFTLQLLTSNPSREDGPYVPSDTRQIGFFLATGQTGTYGSVIIDVDSISIRPE